MFYTCTKLTNAIFTSPGDFVLLKILQVEEGSQELITTENIKLLLDLRNLGTTETEVIFHLIEFPKHGELSLGKNMKKKKYFTLQHLMQKKLNYIHNGKENIQDSFVFEIEIESPASNSLPEYLNMRQRFLFEIRILPVNDKPHLSGGPGLQNVGLGILPILPVTAGTSLHLPPNLLQITDQDTKLDKIVIAVTYNNSG